ncbi:MAG: SRPBCC family protein [Chloroflexota bacterium]|nr:SRPBCC family protein [Chloroflexota bacterium]
MATVERSVLIQAPVERVFGYAAVPAHLPEFWPSMLEIKDVQPLPNGGHRFRWVYQMAGMRFEGTSEDVEYLPNYRMMQKSKGGIDSTISWTFQTEADGVRVTFVAAYSVPVPLLGRLAEAAIAKVNEQETETLLANLKARLEA